ncbi:MAG: hypothetical protein C9356_15650 [Oleiphilus sp.]|nr:MAG: hypothetical protein C9356_15650 [Oleiphilus sp.]
MQLSDEIVAYELITLGMNASMLSQLFDCDIRTARALLVQVVAMRRIPAGQPRGRKPNRGFLNIESNNVQAALWVQCAISSNDYKTFPKRLIDDYRHYKVHSHAPLSINKCFSLSLAIQAGELEVKTCPETGVKYVYDGTICNKPPSALSSDDAEQRESAKPMHASVLRSKLDLGDIL